MGLRDIVEQRRAERERQQRPKSLRELRARKEAMREQAGTATPRAPGLRGLRQDKMRKASSKLDFSDGGIRYHNVQQVDGYWMIDVSNGDKTFTLHNQFGAWMHNVADREGYMKEPVVVARMLGTNIGQLEICQNLNARLDRELKLRHIPTREQHLREKEQEAVAARRKKRKKDDDDE